MPTFNSWFPEELFQKDSGATSGFRGNEIRESFMTAALGTGGKVATCAPRLLELIHLDGFLVVQAELSRRDMNIAEEIMR